MRFFSLALVSVLCGALWVPAASARPAAGLTTNNALVVFDTNTPTTLTSGPTAISGLGAGETLVDIDIRPSNRLLYGLSKDATGVGRLYTINPNNGVATLVSTLGATGADATAPYTALNGTEFGIDFNPVPDRLRVTSDTGQNLRIDVTNGLVTTDGDLNPGTPLVTANAYTNSNPGATSTTLYGIDFANPSLVIQNPPNNGTLTVVGGLGVSGATTVSGFDIAPNNTDSFATVSGNSSGSTLGSINLTTGQFTPIGSGFIGGGSALRGFALLAFPVEKGSPVVTTATDSLDAVDGKTSLREAINFANASPDTTTINFNLPSGERTISLLTALPALSTNISIVGPTTNGVTVARSSGQGTPDFRIFDISAGVTARLTSLSIANGRVVNVGGSSEGAGIRNYGQSLTLTNCTVRDNFAGGNQGSNVGGGVLNGNNAPSASRSAFVAINSTFSGNTVEASLGQGFGASGGALLNNFGTMSLLNCTVAANQATGSNGSAAEGGGIASFSGGLTLKNTIVASNVADGGPPNISGPFSNGGGNIIGGDPKLGPLADNGGPTPTHALLPGSPAINAAVSGAPSRDQRGVARGSRPDSGAYEFVNSIPEVVSVTPQNETDAVGEQQTFALTVTDGDGATDITEMWLLINTRLDWAEGATLVYFPQTGELYLRQGDTFLPPIKIGAAAGASDILDNGAIRIVGSQVSIESSGNGLTLTIPATIRNGLVGNNTLYGRVQDASGAVDVDAVNGTGYVPFSPYTVTSQFADGNNDIPTLSALSPRAASTVIPTTGIRTQSFVFYAKDEDGIGDLDSLWFTAGKVRDGANGATLVFLPRTRRLYLRSDDGNSFLGGGRIGTQGSIENSQVKVDLSQVQYFIYSDGKSVGLRLNLQPKAGLIGQNTIWLRVQDNSGATSTGGDNLGFVQSGTWNVTQQSSTTTAAPSAPGS